MVTIIASTSLSRCILRAFFLSSENISKTLQKKRRASGVDELPVTISTRKNAAKQKKLPLRSLAPWRLCVSKKPEIYLVKFF